MSKISFEKKEKVKELLSKGLKINEIANLVEITRHTVRKIKNNGYKPKLSKYLYLVDKFKDLSNRDLNYYLGLLATDGSIHNNRLEIRLKESDKDILDNFKLFLNLKQPLGKVSKTINNKIFYGFRLSFRSKECCDILNKYGITERKSHNLKLNIPFNWDLLRGIIDGDGSFVNPKSKNSRFRINIVTASKTFSQQIKDFLNSNNIQFTESIVNKKSTYYNININKQESIIKTINNLYNNTNTYIKRKYFTAQQIRNYLHNKLSNSVN